MSRGLQIRTARGKTAAMSATQLRVRVNYYIIYAKKLSSLQELHDYFCFCSLDE
jgi:hypothetical protein